MSSRGHVLLYFFGALETEVVDLVAADEKRHNIVHISKYIPVRDLIEQVRSKLSEGTPIPSKSTVLCSKELQGCTNNAFVAQNVKSTVT